MDQDGVKVVERLAALAQRELSGGHMKDAADLLRAAEHLSFAAASSGSSQDAGVDSHLEKAVADEVEELLHRAEQHWEKEEQRHDVVSVLYARSGKRAAKALRAGELATGIGISPGG